MSLKQSFIQAIKSLGQATKNELACCLTGTRSQTLVGVFHFSREGLADNEVDGLRQQLRQSAFDAAAGRFESKSLIDAYCAAGISAEDPELRRQVKFCADIQTKAKRGGKIDVFNISI